jgi:hypothetical protein
MSLIPIARVDEKATPFWLKWLHKTLINAGGVANFLVWGWR